MLQSRISAFIEFKRSISTEEFDKVMRDAFPDNIHSIHIGVDHKNFWGMSKVGVTNNNGDSRKAYEVMAKGGVPIVQDMRCIPCNRTWRAGGYRNKEGIFLFENQEICKGCGNIGERIE